MIVCSIEGSFERKDNILEEPKIEGFGFNKKDETKWPKVPIKKRFLIGKCGRKIEIDDESLLLSSSIKSLNP